MNTVEDSCMKVKQLLHYQKIWVRLGSQVQRAFLEGRSDQQCQMLKRSRRALKCHFDRITKGSFGDFGNGVFMHQKQCWMQKEGALNSPMLLRILNVEFSHSSCSTSRCILKRIEVIQASLKVQNVGYPHTQWRIIQP